MTLPLPPLNLPSPGESSFSYLNDFLLGQPVIDRFTRLTLDFTEKLKMGSKAALPQLFKTYRWVVQDGGAGWGYGVGARQPCCSCLTYKWVVQDGGAGWGCGVGARQPCCCCFRHTSGHGMGIEQWKCRHTVR